MPLPDCPICLSPLSSPWGATCCGHPYHTECWDQVVQFGKKKCPMCKSNVKSFREVFLEFDADDEDVCDAGDDVNVEIEELKKEWEEVHRELSALLSDGEVDEIDVQWKRPIDEDENHGTQDVQDIYDTFNLFSPARKSTVHGAESESDSVSQAADCDCRETDQEQQQKHLKMQKLLSRLHEIHTTLMDLAPTTSSNNSSQLKSRYISLRKNNTSLESQIEALVSEKTKLQTDLNKAKQSSFNTHLETERMKRQRDEWKDKHVSLLATHSNYQEKTNRTISRLEKSNSKLQKLNSQLKSVSELADVEEMQEITVKYNRMSQQLHDVTTENRLLKRRMEEMERRRSEMESIRRLESDSSGKENSLRKVSRGGSINNDRGAVKGAGDAISSNTKSNTSRAMDILNSAPSRKSASKPKNNRPRGCSQGNSRPVNKVRDISRYEHDDESQDGDAESNIQLLMTTKHPRVNRPTVSSGHLNNTSIPLERNNSINYATTAQPLKNAIPFQRHDSVNSTKSIGTKRMLKESATKSVKKSTQSISHFFKPLGD